MERRSSNEHKKSRLFVTFLFSFLLVFALTSISFISFGISGCSDDDDDDAAPTSTATTPPTPTPTPSPEVTPTETPFAQGWAEEEIAHLDGGDWISVTGNAKGEMIMSYLRGIDGQTYVGYVKRDLEGNWSPEMKVPGSVNNVLYNKAFIRSVLHEDGDVHIVWTDLGRESIFYNHYDAAAATWAHNPRAFDVIQGEDLIHPDIATTPDNSKLFVSCQVQWGAGLNWNYGAGWQAEADIPLWNTNGECKTPRIAYANGKLYMVIYDYFWHDGHSQIGINEFDENTNTWSGWIAPAPVSGGTYPGFPSIAVGSDNSIHLTWFNWHAGTEFDELIYLKRNPDGSWNAPEILVSGTMMVEGYNSFFPCVAVNDDGVVMVVYATSMETEGKMRYLVKKTGENWTAPALVTTSEDQYYPTLTAIGNMFVVGWLDKKVTDNWDLMINRYIP